MNILFLTHQGGMAGSTYSLYYLADGLAQRGHSVFVGCKKSSLLFTLLKDSKAMPVPMTFRHKFDLKNMRHIAGLVREHDIQLINAQSGIDRYTSIWASFLFHLNTPVVHTRRQTPRSSGFFLQNWFYTRGTAGIVAVSQGVRDALVKLGLPARHITVIRNGTPAGKYELSDSEFVETLREKWKLEPGQPVIGCVSRKKQQEQLLEALQFIDEHLTVFFIGLEKRDEYVPLLEKLYRHDIHFLGHKSQQETLYYYKLFTVKVLPSVTEGLSQALLEAMALGVPVIASRAAGNIDLIRDGENGLLFEPGNVKKLAGLIKQVLADKNLRDWLIQNGRHTALVDFSIDRTIECYEKYFKQIISGDHF